jgi:hypothetical protein
MFSIIINIHKFTNNNSNNNINSNNFINIKDIIICIIFSKNEKNKKLLFCLKKIIYF